jgi:hypothetical protein
LGQSGLLLAFAAVFAAGFAFVLAAGSTVVFAALFARFTSKGGRCGYGGYGEECH